MTVDDAKNKLKLLRKTQVETAKEIAILRQFIKENTSIVGRNNEIRQLYLQGWNYKNIAEKYKLSSTRISYICKGVKRH